MKDDSRLHPLYGGNKVRKLEYLLFGALPRVITIGALGSHHVLATALHARALGHEVEAVMLPRPWSAHAERVLRASATAATLLPFADVDAAIAEFRRRSVGATSIPAGGSSPLGSLGYVRAGLELAEQVRAGLLPEPKRIFVALGTAGTAAGLAVGLRAAGLGSEVVGVRVVPAAYTRAERVAELGVEIAALAGMAPAPVTIDDRWLGAGYGHPTAAAENARADGISVESTYTGKALAAALAEPGGPHLYWHTLSGTPLPEGPVLERAAWPWT